MYRDGTIITQTTNTCLEVDFRVMVFTSNDLMLLKLVCCYFGNDQCRPQHTFELFQLFENAKLKVLKIDITKIITCRFTTPKITNTHLLCTC